MFIESDTDSLVSVSPLGKLETNLRVFKTTGYIDYYNKDIERNQNRQNTKDLYAVNGSIYFSKVASFLEYKTFHIEKVIGL
jgi:CMP-N-acetylneuraminic acid synthetase